MIFFYFIIKIEFKIIINYITILTIKPNIYFNNKINSI